MSLSTSGMKSAVDAGRPVSGTQPATRKRRIDFGLFGQTDVTNAIGMTPEAVKWSRIWDFLVLFAVVTLFMGAIHLHVMLTVGDWDMFVDWKDRQYWVLLMPISIIMIPAALQAIFWTYFRLPIGATAGVTLLFIGTWITRAIQWHVWVDFPFSMMVPSTAIAGGILMDIALIITRNGLFTSIFGGFAFAFTFWPANYAALVQFYQPIDFNGTVASVADQVGYVFNRSNMPEYLRIIERGTLRTFGGSAAWVSSAFAGFICIFMTLFWWQVGMWMSTVRYLPNSDKIKAMMGIKTVRPAVSE